MLGEFEVPQASRTSTAGAAISARCRRPAGLRCGGPWARHAIGRAHGPEILAEQLAAGTARCRRPTVIDPARRGPACRRPRWPPSRRRCRRSRRDVQEAQDAERLARRVQGRRCPSRPECPGSRCRPCTPTGRRRDDRALLRAQRLGAGAQRGVAGCSVVHRARASPMPPVGPPQKGTADWSWTVAALSSLISSRSLYEQVVRSVSLRSSSPTSCRRSCRCRCCRR